MNLFMNGVEILRVENNKYYIDAEECLQEVSKREFIDELNNMAWVCLTSWNKELRQQYLDIVDYVNNVKKCPNCSKEYYEPSAISRKDNKTEICSNCGVQEALEQFYGV